MSANVANQVAFELNTNQRPVWGLRGENDVLPYRTSALLSVLWISNCNVLPSHMCVDWTLAPDSEHFLPENYSPLYLALTHTSNCIWTVSSEIELHFYLTFKSASNVVQLNFSFPCQNAGCQNTEVARLDPHDKTYFHVYDTKCTNALFNLFWLMWCWVHLKSVCLKVWMQAKIPIL